MSHLPLFTCYSFTALSNADLIDMHDVARSMLLHEDFILDHKKGRVLFQTEEAIPFEPYYLLSPSSVCQLFNSSMAEQPVPISLIQEVSRLYQPLKMKLQSYRESCREFVNGLSMFAGRNPLVSSLAALYNLHGVN